MLKPKNIRFRALEKVKVRPRSLVQICLQRVAENFLQYDNLHAKLGRKQLEDVYAMLDLDMPLPEAALRINDENYWKRRTQAKHPNAQVEKHGMSWKQTYLEIELQEALERVPITVEYGNPELEALKQQVMASRLYVYQLQITQFPSHLDLSFIFDALPALCTFSITYGNKRLGMDYERAMFGMKISDAQYLARDIRVSQTLVSLSLPCNMIDDELVKVLMGGLSYGHMLTHLDLSHNKIGDRGARRLASLLDPDYCLQALDLSDNQIHANGCMHLGAHLAENITCQVLNLRLNRCEDNGVSHLFQDMCVNKHLQTLNIACNDLTVRCLPYLNAMLAENGTLLELDVSANPLHQVEEEGVHQGAAGESVPPLASSEAASDSLEATKPLDEDDPLEGLQASGQLAVFARCLAKSPSLLRVDLRSCGLPADVAQRVTTAVKHRELIAKGIPVEAYEKARQAAVAAEEAAQAAREAAEKEEQLGEGEDEDGEEKAEGKAEEEKAEGEAEKPEAEEEKKEGE
ncbi:DRC5 [Symbiodinium necroappetens]|uniref:DRC5 protein n=1 Tax=Symbiodinium necroappetens TaxID=1628268 RepID=A0A812MGN3_9DINO|nr:DRC5 [Symbiodinium microadriaticum]CAE7268102.1 DRC5 [Symbiodinium necroappetens]CAE7932747.1 DRC5 [Symbiodinium sp. KB8]